MGNGIFFLCSFGCFCWPRRKPKLHVTRFYSKDAGHSSFWYADIQNIGKTVANGFRFQLDGIESDEKDKSCNKDLFPYDVRPEKIKHLQNWSAIQLTIDRDERVPFELFETRLSSDNHFRIVGLDARNINRLNDSAMGINPGEEIVLTYNVCAYDANLLTFHVHIYFKDGKPFAEKID